jgi:hypothetical protein
MVLPETMFIKFTTLKKSPFSALNESIIAAQTINSTLLNPLIQPHNLSQLNDLWWKGDTLIVIRDNNLNKEVLHIYHDTSVAKQLGILNTFSLIKHNY